MSLPPLEDRTQAAQDWGTVASETAGEVLHETAQLLAHLGVYADQNLGGPFVNAATEDVKAAQAYLRRARAAIPRIVEERLREELERGQ